MSKTQAPDPAHDLKAQALALCHALEEQPGSQYQTAAVLAAFKVYRAFESIEKHGEIRQWVFDVAAPSAMPAPSAAYLTKNGRLHVTAWECHGCGHRGIDDGDDANEACSDCDWRGPCPDEDVCPGCGREGTMVSACPKCGDRYYIKAEADLVIPTAIPAPEGGPTIQDLAAGAHYPQASAWPAASASPTERLDKLLWEAIDYAASHPVEAQQVDPRTWHHLLTYSTYTPSPAEGDGMLEPLVYAAMMHSGTPKTVAEFERAAANVAGMLERRAAAQPLREALPHPGSPEADKMLDALLAEYGHPANAKNAARAGYMAARRLLQHARHPLPAAGDAEPIGWGGVIETCAELCDPNFIAQQDLDELKRYAGNWNSTYRFFPIYAPEAERPATSNPQPKGTPFQAARVADLVAKLRDTSGGHISGLYDAKAADLLEEMAMLADSEGTRAVEYLRRARKAESALAAQAPAPVDEEPTAFVHWPLNGPPRLVWYSNKALHDAIERGNKAQNGYVPDLKLYAHAPCAAVAHGEPVVRLTVRDQSVGTDTLEAAWRLPHGNYNLIAVPVESKPPVQGSGQ